MQITKHNTLTFLLTLLTGAALSGTAFADTYIRGTQVSYKIKMTDKKVNESSVFVDEANDTQNENYVQFTCEEGAPTFYLHSAQQLYTQKDYDKDTTADLQVKVDGGGPISMTTVSTDNDDKPDLYTLAVSDKFDAQMLRLFQSAQKNVVISIKKPGNKIVSFNFYTKGFGAALSKINLCQ